MIEYPEAGRKIMEEKEENPNETRLGFPLLTCRPFQINTKNSCKNYLAKLHHSIKEIVHATRISRSPQTEI